MGGVRAQGMLERHPNTCRRRGSSRTGWRHLAGHNRALLGSRQVQKARGHNPFITTNNVPHSPQLHFWIVTTSQVPLTSPVAVFPGPEPCNVWAWPGILVPLRRSWGILDKSLNPPVLNRIRMVLTVPTSPQGSSEDSNSYCGPKGVSPCPGAESVLRDASSWVWG